MTRIIKFREASSSASVRPLPSGPRRPVSGDPRDRLDPQLAAARAEIEGVKARLDEKDAEIERLVEALDAAFKDGQADGRDAALKEAAADRDALLEKLDGAIEQSVEILERDLSSLERLSAQLALESLEKILGEPGAFRQLAPQVISHQLAQLDALCVVRIQVSPADFPGADELAALSSAVGQRQVEITTSADLDSGACRINLVLGTLEIGIDQQWPQLRAVLEDLAEPGRRS